MVVSVDVDVSRPITILFGQAAGHAEGAYEFAGKVKGVFNQPDLKSVALLRNLHFFIEIQVLEISTLSLPILLSPLLTPKLLRGFIR